MSLTRDQVMLASWDPHAMGRSWGDLTSAVFFPKPQSKQEEKPGETQTDRFENIPTGTLRDRRGRENQGATGKLSQTRGAEGDLMTESNVMPQVPRDRERTSVNMHMKSGASGCLSRRSERRLISGL